MECPYPRASTLLERRWRERPPLPPEMRSELPLAAVDHPKRQEIESEDPGRPLLPRSKISWLQAAVRVPGLFRPASPPPPPDRCQTPPPSPGDAPEPGQTALQSPPPPKPPLRA